MKVVILAHTPEPEKVVAAAAKLCYSASGVDDILEKMTPEGNKKFIEMLRNLGHESPVEHVSVTFAIEGVSRALLAQITRHRIASYSVQSQRYVDKENFEYIIPPQIESSPQAKSLFLCAMENDRETYRRLKEILQGNHEKRLEESGMDPEKARQSAAKLANEDARYVLPNACDTKIIMTMNLRSIYHFLSLRCCERAQWEIRALAKEMLRQLKGISPILFQHAGPSCVRGACSEGSYTCGNAKKIREEFAN